MPEYKIYYNEITGKVAAINREIDGASIPKIEWPNLGVDLSDRPPTPVSLPPDFSAFGRTLEKSSFWRTKIRKTLQKEAFMELVSKMNLIAIAGSSTERLESLVELWNEVVGSLTVGITISVADVSFLNTASVTNKIPITFAANGTATIT